MHLTRAAMPKKKANTEELTKGTKKKSEYDAKVAKIKAQVKMLMPMVKTKVPELPPLIGTLGFEHLTHPFKPSANSPNLIGAKTVSGKAMAEKLEKTLQAKERKEKLVLREAKRKERLANRTSSTYDSDDDSGDDDSSLPYVKRKAAANMRFEDFVIPDVVDAETGEEVRRAACALPMPCPASLHPCMSCVLTLFLPPLPPRSYCSLSPRGVQTRAERTSTCRAS